MPKRQRSSVPSCGVRPWGFVVYRIAYDDDDEWEAFRNKLDQIVKGSRENILSEGADPRGVTLKFVENAQTLKNATSQQIRL